MLGWVVGFVQLLFLACECSGALLRRWLFNFKECIFVLFSLSCWLCLHFLVCVICFCGYCCTVCSGRDLFCAWLNLHLDCFRLRIVVRIRIVVSIYLDDCLGFEYVGYVA